jgi:hypothetical protein
VSNIKRVRIVAEGEWPLGCDGYHGHEDQCGQFRSLVGNLTLNPIEGLKVKVEHGAKYVDPNRHGGRTLIDRITISGEEAVSWGYLDNLVITMNGAGLNIIEAKALDIEAFPDAIFEGFDIKKNLMGRSIHEIKLDNK